MRKLVSTFAALIAVSCAPSPVLASPMKPEPVPCNKLAHYSMLVLDDSVTPEAYSQWVRRQKFSEEQMDELSRFDQVLAEAARTLPVERLREVPAVVFEVCMQKRGI